MKIVFTMLIIILTQQTLLVADWEKCNTPQNGDFYHISKFGDYYFGATRWNGIARSSDSSNTWEILNNGLKGKSITLIIPSQKSIYIFSNGDVYKSEDFGVTVHYIKNTYFVNQKKYTYSYHNDTLFFIYDKLLKYYVDDFNKLEDIFTQKDSILCNRIFEINGDLIVSTNKGYFRKQNDSYKFIKFDGLDSLPNILYFSTTDDTTYFATEESIFKSDDNLESYTKIFELKDYSISDIQANVDGLFVAFLKRGIGFYNCITKEFEFEEKYKNIGFNKITLIDDNIFFFNDLNLLRTKKIGGEYLVSGYKNSLLSKVRLSNGKIFGILTGRLMTSDDDGLNWHAKGKDFLNLKSFEVIDSVIFIANYNKKEGTEATTFRSSNFGKEWELIPKNKNSPFVANDFLYFNNDLYISVIHPMGTMPSILKSTNNGLNWSEYINDFGGNNIFIYSYEFFGNDTCIFVGSDLNQNSFISYTYDGGLTSSYLKLNNVSIINSISKTDKILFVGSGNGKVLKSSDFGKNWIEVDYFNNNNSSAIKNVKFEKNIGIVSNQNGEIYKSDDYGDNWRKVETGLSGNFAFYQTIFIENKIIISGKNNTSNTGILLITNDSGNTWNILFENDEGFRGTFTHENFLYCVSHHRNLWQSDFNTVSFENEVINNSYEILSLVTANRILNTNINLENEIVNNLQITDILGNNIGNDNFRVISQNPFTIDINNTVQSGVFFLSIYKSSTIKAIKFFML